MPSETNTNKMKTIKFSDLELESMIQMYQDELAEANMYVEQIKDVLKKLHSKPAKEEVVEKQPKQGKKRGRKPSKVAATVKSVVESLLTKAPEKEIKPVSKK